MRNMRFKLPRPAAVLLPFLLSACQTPPGLTEEALRSAKTVQVNGYPMAYVENGKGPTIVLVHGSLHDYRYWSRESTAWSNRFRVVALSLRHYYPEHWDGRGSDELCAEVGDGMKG